MSEHSTRLLALKIIIVLEGALLGVAGANLLHLCFTYGLDMWWLEVLFTFTVIGVIKTTVDTFKLLAVEQRKEVEHGGDDNLPRGI